LCELGLQNLDLAFVAIANIQTRAQGVNEAEPVSPGSLNELAQSSLLVRGVEFPPVRAVFQIIFGRVEVSIEPGVAHPLEQLEPIELRPRLAIEPFDDSGEKWGGFPTFDFCSAICRAVVSRSLSASGVQSGIPMVKWQQA
jgi:hypothetical protein